MQHRAPTGLAAGSVNAFLWNIPSHPPFPSNPSGTASPSKELTPSPGPDVQGHTHENVVIKINHSCPLAGLAVQGTLPSPGGSSRAPRVPVGGRTGRAPWPAASHGSATEGNAGEVLVGVAPPGTRRVPLILAWSRRPSEPRICVSHADRGPVRPAGRAGRRQTLRRPRPAPQHPLEPAAWHVQQADAEGLRGR